MTSNLLGVPISTRKCFITHLSLGKFACRSEIAIPQLPLAYQPGREDIIIDQCTCYPAVWTGWKTCSPQPGRCSTLTIVVVIVIVIIIIITITITLKFATPSEQYVDWGNNINFIFMRDKHVDWGNNINFIFIATRSQTRRNVRVAANMFQRGIMSQ